MQLMMIGFCASAPYLYFSNKVCALMTVITLTVLHFTLTIQTQTGKGKKRKLLRKSLLRLSEREKPII